MFTNPLFYAAAEFAAAFDAVPTGVVAVPAIRDHGITSTEMTKDSGQARRPRKTPL